jgi:hypothetical protein
MLSGDQIVDLVEFGKLRTECGQGVGVAACLSLGVVVTTNIDTNTLMVWDLNTAWGPDQGPACPAGPAGKGFRLLRTLGHAKPSPQMKFKFRCRSWGESGHLAFTHPQGHGSHPLLLVTDAGQGAVHIINPVRGTHSGYLLTPKDRGESPGGLASCMCKPWIPRPRGVATCINKPLVAVTVWGYDIYPPSRIELFSGQGTRWQHIRMVELGDLGSMFKKPFGLRFNRTGSALCVTDQWNGRIAMFSVGNSSKKGSIDCSFVNLIATGLRGPMDVEEVTNGWLVACTQTDKVHFLRADGSRDHSDLEWYEKVIGGVDHDDGRLQKPSGLAFVPGLGLIIREDSGGRMKVFSDPSTVAMVTMSHLRTAWMTVVVRAGMRRHQHRDESVMTHRRTRQKRP